MAALAAAWPGLAVPAPPATFVQPAGSSLLVRATDADGRTFVSVGDVATALGGTLSYDAATASYELKVGPHTAVFGTETAIAVVDTKLVQLTSPVRGEGSTAFADADFFTRVLSPLFGVTFSWDRVGRTLAARRVETPEIGVEALPSEVGGAQRIEDLPEGDVIRIPAGTSLPDAEKVLILDALARTNGNKTAAARILKIGLRTLYRKLAEYGQLDGPT